MNQNRWLVQQRHDLQTLRLKRGEAELCDICCEHKRQDSMFLFCCDTHSFCRMCISNTLDNAIQSFIVVKCPADDCALEFTRDSPYYESAT